MRNLSSLLRRALVALVLAISPAAAGPMTVSYGGTFLQDNDVVFFPLQLDVASRVTMISYSYAGGINAAGQAIPRGGFDPVLAVFDFAGFLIAQNDDGNADVPADALTGATFDSFLALELAAGDYTIALMQFDNEAIGPTLGDGFVRPAAPDFTTGFGCVDAQPRFNDVSGVPGCGRSNAFAFDVLVNTPEPTGAAILAVSLLGIASRRRR